ncbi:unnamed protein product, partial [Rotaria sordida]
SSSSVCRLLRLAFKLSNFLGFNFHVIGFILLCFIDDDDDNNNNNTNNNETSQLTMTTTINRSRHA